MRDAPRLLPGRERPGTEGAAADAERPVTAAGQAMPAALATTSVAFSGAFSGKWQATV